MSTLTAIDNQAVKLRLPGAVFHNDNNGDCQDHVDYCQLVTCSDQSNFQIEYVASEMIEGGDFTQHIQNGTFTTSAAPWVLVGAGVAFSVDHLAYATGAADGSATQAIVLKKGFRYTLTYTISNFAGPFQGQILLDGVLLANISANGTFTVHIDLRAAVSNGASLVIRNTPGFDVTFDLDDVMIITGHWEQGVNWDIFFDTNQRAVKTSGSAGNTIYRFKESLFRSHIYRVSFDLKVIPTGGTLTLKLGGETVTIIDTTDATGIQTFFHTLTVNPFITHILELDSDSAWDGEIDDITVKDYSVGIAIIDCADDTVAFLETDGSSVIKSANSLTKVQIDFDWSNLISSYVCQTGCYKIKIIDLSVIPTDSTGAFFVATGSEEVTNGTFDSAGAPWAFPAGWAHDAVNFEADGTATTSSVTQTAAGVAAPKVYIASLQIKNFSSGILFGVAGSTSFIQVSANGIFTSAYTHVGSTTVGFGGIFIGAYTGSVDDYSIQEATALQAAIDAGSIIADFCSECFQLEISHACTVKITATNNKDAFGLDFENFSLVQSIRVDGILRNPRFLEELDQNRSSTGDTDVRFFSSEEIEELFIFAQPKYVHQFLRLVKGMRQVTIDDIAHILRPSDYEPQWSQHDLASVSLDAQKSADFNENRVC